MNQDHPTPIVLTGTTGTGGTKSENTAVQLVPVAESGPGPTGPLKTTEVLYGPGGPGGKNGTGTSKTRKKQGRVTVVPVVPPKNRVPGPAQDRDQLSDLVESILARLNLDGDHVGEEPHHESRLFGPVPEDVLRILEEVKTWHPIFEDAFHGLVKSALIAGRTRSEAVRIAYRSLLPGLREG